MPVARATASGNSALRRANEPYNTAPSALSAHARIDADDISAAASAAPSGAAADASSEFQPLTAAQAHGGSARIETRRIPVPPHRMTPLKEKWLEIHKPIVEHMLLQVRMNVKLRSVELRTSEATQETQALQKAADFVKAFLLGFDVSDAIALLRLDDLFLETFEIKDVKPLHGDHLSRAIGRIAGKDGKTKFAIENATRTRIVLAETKIHLLGSYNNIKVARDAVCDLILGSPPGKVYTKLRTIASRLKERF